MRPLLFGDLWIAQSLAEQALWLVAIVSTLLLGILLVLSLLSPDREAEEEPDKPRLPIFNARFILVFFAAFGWVALILYHQGFGWSWLLAFSFAAGLAVAALGKAAALLLLRLIPRRSHGNEERLLLQTGKVLEPIPSHRNGFGKVQLDMRGTPYELEAITAGKELRPGDGIRVIGIIDERIILVEPIEGQGYPHEQPFGGSRG
ncbi:MAG: NfeD family protein [Phaeodactylibacter sp.]|nr:NfeD family protein [Phaeodactylibacter sp.]MCB9272531.1 NfeD family protein [Lewinellaceae bacterium]